MAYTINRYNNAQLTVVEDGTIDQTTDIKLVGKNYAGYGEIQNENMVFLLENFAGTSAPPRALSGQVWFDSSNSKLKFYDGTKWRTTGGAEVSSASPAGLKQGDFWWDTGNEQLYAYNGTSFVLVGPQSAGSGQTQILSATVRDTSNVSQPIIKAVVNDEVVYIISSTDFTIDTGDANNAIPGFDRVRKGLTLKNTLNANGGVTSTDHRFHGTASNADKLGGIAAGSFVQTGSASFGTLVSFADAGIPVGDNNDLKIKIENDNQGLIANEVGTMIKLSAKDSGGIQKNSLRIFANSIEPGLQSDNVTTEVVSLGSTSRQYTNVYATNFTGLSEKASALVVGGNVRNGDTAATANTVAVRDASGDLYATLFRGTATAAQYADLAEKYTTNEDQPVGTVMAVGGEAETRPANVGDIAVGVISENPAYLMNAEADGQALALKGRVPVRVIGPVSKGMAVYAWKDGVAGTIQANALVGVALETSTSEEEKLIECVLKV